jgi:Zn-finger nucleic acid-binding protein
MNPTCPNCGAHASRQQTLTENQKRCGSCNTVWLMGEQGPQIIKEGQTFLSEVPSAKDTI